MNRTGRFACLCVILPFLFSCAVGPDYKRPDASDITPADWRFKTAEPKDAVPKGEWWKVFDDTVLEGLEKGAVADSQNLRAAVARVDEARAAARLSRSRFFPEVSLDPSFERQLTSGNLPTPIPVRIPASYVNTFSVPFDMSYEVDLWGRVRRSFEGARADAEASVADYQNVLLTLSADIAVNYFLLRSLDAQVMVLDRTVESREESVSILNARCLAGSTPETDVDRARTQLADARADLADLVRQRTETLNAIALLCGKPASSFEIPKLPLIASPPVVPSGLPSSLLERRPDIARAERTLAAKNAQIGVAKAAYFPALSLTGQAGYLSNTARTMFLDSSEIWSIGPSVTMPLFNAGRTAAQVRQAEATYAEFLADYRQTVLTAFKEVEDALAQVTLLNKQVAARAEALASAKRVTELVGVRYEAGAVTYLDVVDAEERQLEQESTKTQIEGQRFAATVRLIKALGGGWD